MSEYNDLDLEAAYDEGYKAAQEDCAPPNVWVILCHDLDFYGSEANFVSVVGSEFAAQETIDSLNTKQPEMYRYYYKEVSIEAV